MLKQKIDKKTQIVLRPFDVPARNTVAALNKLRDCF
jgi:hypothetical protein